MAEKPSQARNFARAFFGNERTFEGTYQGQQLRIVPLRGHLFELESPGQQYKGAEAIESWKLETLPWDESRFQWKFGLRKDARSVLSNAKTQLKDVDEIVIATDDDPGTHEGSGLACEVLLYGGISAPMYSRMYFVDESAKEVQKAFKSRKPLPHDLRTWSEWKVAFFRNRWDFLAGLQETRAATVIGGGWDYVLRNGRLKSAMLVLVGSQLERVASYQKIPFFQNRFHDDYGVDYVNPEEPQFKERSQVPNVYHASRVVMDGRERKHAAPPRLMDLASVSATLAKDGLTSKQVLDIYQSLYESQIVSYPRTEDRTITPEQFDELAQNVDAIARVVGVDTRLLTHRAPRKTHVKPKGAHGANRPGPNVPRSLADLDAEFGRGAGAIYELVARSALAMFAEDYEYDHEVGHIADYPAFVGSVNVPVTDGWHAVLGRELVDEDADANAQGLGTTAGPYVYEGYPPRPQRPTMKWLMGQLERRNVGTGATRTSTYAEVTAPNAKGSSKKSQLLVDTRGTISMAPAGERAYQLLPGTHIGSLELTEQVFEQMAAIERGELDPEQVLAHVRDFVTEDIETMQANAAKQGIQAAAPVEVERVQGTWQGKPVEFKRVFSGHRFTDKEVASLLAGETVSFDAVSKEGRPYTATGTLGESTFKGRKIFGFQLAPRADVGDMVSGTFKRKKVSFKRTFSGHRFTDEEVEALLAGKTISFEAISKAGNPYTATGALGTKTWKGRKIFGFQLDTSGWGKRK